MTTTGRCFEDNDDVSDNGIAKEPALELTTFTKYSKLDPVLREHALSFANRKTLKEYAQCSKLCNAEIQKFNTRSPNYLVFKEESYGIKVYIGYYNCESKNQTKIFPHGATMIRDAEDFVMQQYRYVKHGKPDNIKIDAKHWPTRMMKIKNMSSVLILTVHLNEFILNDFMQFIATTNIKMGELVLLKPEDDDSIVLRPDFFKSEIVKSVYTLDIHPKVEIEKNDFLSLANRDLYFNCWIEIEFIQEIVLKHINLTDAGSYELRVYLPTNESREFEIDELFPSDRFALERMNGSHFKIGSKVEGNIHFFKKRLFLSFH